MTTEHDLAHGRRAPGAPSPLDDDVVPGRGSRSSQLAAPSHPIASGLLSRKARDANGVAEGADAAIATASSTSGSPLPETIQRKFESSLGTDLSNVRVHTRAESHVAAESVSAKAYAIGQDIHFAAGQYEPSSTAGQHLLAHEVAHTVQQRGAVARAAFKLDVSAPADALEIEADRAADAMVAGSPAHVSSGCPSIARDFRQDLEPKPPEPSLLPGQPPNPDIGVKPNPLDPFEQPPTNWDSLTTAVPGPDHPAEWAGTNHAPLQPLPQLRADGRPCSRVTADQNDAANAALRVFEGDYAAANASWNSMIPAITSFTEASKDLGGTGILGSEGGMGWNAGGNDADLSKLTAQQKLGPGSDKTMDDLFKNKSGVAGTDVNVNADGAKGTKKTKELLNSAKRCSNEAVIAGNEHQIAQRATKGTAEGVLAAITLVDINASQITPDMLTEVKDNLQKEKADATEILGQVLSSIEALDLIGFGLAEVLTPGKAAEGAESLIVGGAIAGEIIGKLVINARYDDQIEVVDKQLKSAIAGIRSKQAVYIQATLNSALIAHDAAMARIRTTKATMLSKVAAYQSAYDAFAAESGKAAGGGAKGAQVQAALEAVPRIEYCLGQISQIIVLIKLPIYTDASGKGFNGFGKPRDFLTYLSQMKGYQSKFKQLETMWKARLASVRKTATQFGP